MATNDQKNAPVITNLPEAEKKDLSNFPENLQNKISEIDEKLGLDTVGKDGDVKLSLEEMKAKWEYHLGGISDFDVDKFTTYFPNYYEGKAYSIKHKEGDKNVTVKFL